MRKEISVLIADDNIEFGNLLDEYMNKEEDLYVVGIARDGLQAFDLIKTLEPDVVILDIIMPNLDGIGVLERVSAAKMQHKPLFIMLSAIGQDIFIQKAIALGAEYYVVKPFDVDILISRIRQVYKEKHLTAFSTNRISQKPGVKPAHSAINDPAYNLEVEVTNLMRDVGIPPHVIGYRYIREAVIQTVNSQKAFSSITKVLYPEIAKKFGSNPPKVERAIRNAIDSAWTKGNPGANDSAFSSVVSFRRGKPTNAEFIAAMAEHIRIKLGLR